jgi:hypothetical protein
VFTPISRSVVYSNKKIFGRCFRENLGSSYTKHDTLTTRLRCLQVHNRTPHWTLSFSYLYNCSALAVQRPANTASFGRNYFQYPTTGRQNLKNLQYKHSIVLANLIHRLHQGCRNRAGGTCLPPPPLSISSKDQKFLL